MDNEFGMHDDEIEDIIEKPISRVKVCYLKNICYIITNKTFIYVFILKSIEELRSHTIDEELNDINKSIVLLKSSYEVQLIVGVKMIPFLLKNDKNNCINKVFPQFKVNEYF
jgi:hypothetical protein